MSDFSRIPSSNISPTHSRSRLAGLVLLALSAALPLAAQTQTAAANAPLTAVPTRNQKIIRRWSVAGDPHGVAVGGDGTIYVGLAQPQAVIAVDPKTGAVKKKVVLDSPDIASTKELVTLRTNPDASLLYIANGSDESASILALPDLHIVREITMEGEPIRDALPDPKGRYLFLLGRRVHVFDARGEQELKTLPVEEPMSIAITSSGATLAVVAPENFGTSKATSVALFDTTTFAEVARDPMQTDKPIEEALFAANDGALIGVARDSLFEKPLAIGKAAKQMTSASDGKMHMSIDFGDLVSSERVCLPEGSGPQIATLASQDLLLFAERRCTVSGVFTASKRKVTPASLYGVDAYALAYDREQNSLVVTERAGYLTIYKVPRPAIAK